MILPLWTPFRNRIHGPFNVVAGGPDAMKSKAFDSVQKRFSHTRRLIDELCKGPDRPGLLQTPNTACSLRRLLVTVGRAAASAGFHRRLQCPLPQGRGLDKLNYSCSRNLLRGECRGIEQKVPRLHCSGLPDWKSRDVSPLGERGDHIRSAQASRRVGQGF